MNEEPRQFSRVGYNEPTKFSKNEITSSFASVADYSPYSPSTPRSESDFQDCNSAPPSPPTELYQDIELVHFPAANKD